MRRFIVNAEVSMTEDQYNEVLKWGVEACDHINAVISDHTRDRGYIVKTVVTEVDKPMLDRVVNHVDHLVEADAYNDLENEIIARACIGGVCED